MFPGGSWAGRDEVGRNAQVAWEGPAVHGEAQDAGVAPELLGAGSSWDGRLSADCCSAWFSPLRTTPPSPPSLEMGVYCEHGGAQAV